MQHTCIRQRSQGPHFVRAGAKKRRLTRPLVRTPGKEQEKSAFSSWREACKQRETWGVDMRCSICDRDNLDGFAIGSLVLGVVGVVLSPILLGGLLAIVGITLATVHLRRRRPREKLARWGRNLSEFALGLAVACGFLYFMLYMEHEDSKYDQGVSLVEWEGVPAPDLTITALDGTTWTLSELKGKRVVLDFWATWCPPCLKEIPHFQQIADESSRENLLVIGISDEDEETLETFVEEESVTYPIASMNYLPSPYGDVESIPTTFIIDRNGVIQSVLSGYHELEDLKEVALADDYQGEVQPEPSSTHVNATDDDGHTRLFHAAMDGDVEAVEALIARGADVEIEDDSGHTTLMHAAMKGHAPVLEVLLSHGADVHAKDTDEGTALFHAARNGHASAARVVLQHGADPYAEDQDGATPLTSARHRRHDEVVALLEAHEVKGAKLSTSMEEP